MAKIKDKLEYSIKNIDKQSIVFPQFVMSIGVITVNLSSELLNGNGPGLFGQNTKKEITPLNMMRVLIGTDDFFLKHATAFCQIHGFLKWFLEQEAPEEENEDYDCMWYDVEFVGTKWNEWQEAEHGKTET